MMDNPSFRPPAEPSVGRNARESVIDSDCFFEGTFRTPGNMRIEGTYQGQIECQGTLLIAENGNVNARIVAGSLIVAGQFSGEAQCESRIEILRTGRASGAIGAKSTVVHDGAFFEGEIRMGGDAGTGRSAGAAIAGSQPAAPAQTSRPLIMPESPPEQQRATEESESAEDAHTETEPTAAPRANGRRQSSTARDVLPNRTGEPG
jgi:cytoskeletal protein CcmA (bactofilin family)